MFSVNWRMEAQNKRGVTKKEGNGRTAKVYQPRLFRGCLKSHKLYAEVRSIGAAAGVGMVRCIFQKKKMFFGSRNLC